MQVFSLRNASANNKGSTAYHPARTELITNSGLSNVSENAANGECSPLKYGKGSNESKYSLPEE